MSSRTNQVDESIRLQLRVTCPHCWFVFSPDKALWIAQHPDLLGDVRLGADHQQRFLPTRFTVDGAAIDSKGFPCRDLACCNCHLPIPRALFETKPFFFSILGAPASGKSYFLASMTWQLRQLLPRQFSLSFSDADPIANLRLQGYESLHFLNDNPEAFVAIEKTETFGDHYDTVLFGDQAINYLRPFLFAISPLPAHTNLQLASKISRVLCMYDNAGESFLPGADTATNPVTRHLALSQALLFLFDPTQDVRFRRACQGKSNDVQMSDRSERFCRSSPVRQDTILQEAANRIRRETGLSSKAKHPRPLIVVVTKYDAWMSVLNEELPPSPWVDGAQQGMSALRMDLIEEWSNRVREVLFELSPEIVAAAESFSDHVIYIPVSATGCGPNLAPETGALGIRPKDIQPLWAEVPLLYTLSKLTRGLISQARRKPGSGDSDLHGSQLRVVGGLAEIYTPPPLYESHKSERKSS